MILTRNEARNLPQLFDAIPAGVKTLVLDHESDDGTAALARERGARVVVRPFAGFVDARRFALSQVQTPWTLMIDADERPDAALRDAIVNAEEDVDGYVVSRTTFYCGKPLRMWSGEPLLRLFRTDRVRLHAAPAAGGEAQLHERWICEGAVRTLDGVLQHYSYPDARSYRRKYDSYTSLEARHVGGSSRLMLMQALLVPLRLANLLLRRGALLDGPRGWIVAWYSALYPAVVAWKARRS
ncbi:MAG TPA: glycosyltransferase family 2 protein [Candidatus Baltobacteraceae bacterium]|nr:glycosyltransferase family 2 protein [Candidatus Baltobacteraceae bacterium]